MGWGLALCATEYTGDNVTDFASTVQNAVSAASPGSTVKIAGTCAGVQTLLGTSVWHFGHTHNCA